MPSRKIWWIDFTAPDFQDLDPMKTIAILPMIRKRREEVFIESEN